MIYSTIGALAAFIKEKLHVRAIQFENKYMK